jgi:anti-sigma factor RsiW
VKDIERMLVSAYEDGEVESPWKEQIERRLKEDSGWSAEADLHLRVKNALAASPEPDFSEAKARVGARLRALSTRTALSPRLPLVWISVAAAALLVVAGGTGYWLGSQSSATSPVRVSELQVQVPRQLELKLSGEGQLLMASTLQESRR